MRDQFVIFTAKIDVMFRYLFVLPLIWIAACTHTRPDRDEHSPSHAGESLRMWAMARSYPDGHFHTEKYAEALAQMRLEASLHSSGRSGNWEAIGPKNIGGRTLCLAIHPLDTTILYAGSASGGLWKSTTGGRGAKAWQRVETGYPVMGVSAIAIDPQNPDVLYIGTGEVYNMENSMPNVAFRTTRGTYGIGILKSTDGGQSWTKSLDWSYGDLRGVQDIKINPLRPATVYAATTEGLLRSTDAGASWQTVHNRKMAVDIEISPADTGVVFVTHGSLNDENISGIFRSTDGGNTFTLLNNGIASIYSGKALLGICAGQPNVIYASVGNDFVQEGLYKSTNNGDSWTKVSTSDVCSYQGWYSHDIAIHPTKPDRIIWSGIDLWTSTNSGASVVRQTLWYSWYFGQVPVGGPEGPSNYVHADIHRLYWSTQDVNKVYCVTDGGIFASSDGGNTWEGRNGGYQTQQFYANLGNSTTNPLLCIGGMQDNSTAIYTGQDAWTRVIGGDGECTAINPLNDQIMYASAQYLNLFKSTNGGQSFYGITTSEMNNEDPCFNGPFELWPTDPQRMYAGAQSLYRSKDGGETWTNATKGYLADGDPILTMAIHPSDPDILLCSTAPFINDAARVFRVNAATGESLPISGLPDRLCMDISYDPLRPDMVYAAFAGFNTGHVYRSFDGGDTWQDISNNLPDVPASTILIDPLYPDNVYVGNDLGVWLWRNGTQSWEIFSADAPSAFPVMHLSVSADRKLRVATHGLGVWQAPMAEFVGTNAPTTALALSVSPNPGSVELRVQAELPAEAKLGLRVLDGQGREILRRAPRRYPAGRQVWTLDCSTWPAGAYAVVLDGDGGGKSLSGSRVFIKR